MTSLFSSPKQNTVTPAPTPMPDPGSVSDAERQKRDLLRAQSMSGRASTILSGQGNGGSTTLGTP